MGGMSSDPYGGQAAQQAQVQPAGAPSQGKGGQQMAAPDYANQAAMQGQMAQAQPQQGFSGKGGQQMQGPQYQQAAMDNAQSMGGWAPQQGLTSSPWAGLQNANMSMANAMGQANQGQFANQQMMDQRQKMMEGAQTPYAPQQWGGVMSQIAGGPAQQAQAQAIGELGARNQAAMSAGAPAGAPQLGPPGGFGPASQAPAGGGLGAPPPRQPAAPGAAQAFQNRFQPGAGGGTNAALMQRARAQALRGR